MNYLSVPHKIKKGETLETIGLKHGYKNPGPIFYFPSNKYYFKKAGKHSLKAGDVIHIPYHPNYLEELIYRKNYIIEHLPGEIQALKRKQIKDTKRIEGILTGIDIANFIAGLGASMATMGAKGLTGTQVTTQEGINWLTEGSLSVASNLTTTMVPSPKKNKKGLKFFVRHTLGPWNPSYWVTVYAAIKEKDMDIYLYGTDAIHQKTIDRIDRQAKEDINRLKKQSEKFSTQKAMPFYRKRI